MVTYVKRITTMSGLATRKQLGQFAEDRARTYLISQGMVFVESNYICRCGEIDLIMQDATDTLVFVEVRYRKSSVFGSAIESVTFQKQLRLIRAAENYLLRYRLAKKYCRFDVVAINKSPIDGTIEWIKNAFQVSS